MVAGGGGAGYKQGGGRAGRYLVFEVSPAGPGAEEEQEWTTRSYPSLGG